MDPSNAEAMLLTSAAVALRIGATDADLRYLRRSDPTFPEPVVTGGPGLSHLWSPGDVDRWLLDSSYGNAP